MKIICRLILFPFCFFLLTGCASFLQKNQLELNQQANVAYESGNVPLSLKYYKKLSVISSADPLVWKRLGNLYVLSHDPSQAIISYSKAAKLSPNDSSLFYNIAIVRLRQAEAELIHAYRTLPPDDPNRQSIVNTLKHLKFLSGIRSSSKLHH